MFNVDGHWNLLQARIRPDLKDLLLMLLKPKAESTLKRYKKEILRFLEGFWCFLCLSLSLFPISTKFTKAQTLMPHYCCLTPIYRGFILSFRVTTTVHSIVSSSKQMTEVNISMHFYWLFIVQLKVHVLLKCLIKTLGFSHGALDIECTYILPVLLQ